MRQDSAACLEVRLRIAGDGVLDPGAYPLGPISFDLPDTLRTARSAIGRATRKEQATRKLAFRRALERDGKLVVALDLADGARLSDLHVPYLRRKVELGWRFARHRDPKLAAALEIDV